MCKWSDDTDRKGRTPVWCRFPLWSAVWLTGVQSYWRQLDASVDHAELSHLRAKRAAVFIYQLMLDFPGGPDGKASVYNVGDPGSIPGSGRSPGEGNGNPLQYYCLENPMDRGAW